MKTLTKSSIEILLNLSMKKNQLYYRNNIKVLAIFIFALLYINIKIFGILNFKASIYNLQGDKILSSTNPSMIYVGNIPQGIYLLKLKDLKSNHTIIEKLIIGE